MTDSSTPRSANLAPHLPTLHKWKERDLSVDALRTHRDLQPREVSLDDRTVTTYAKDMRAGDTFPPILVAMVKRGLYVVDGFHRLAAAQKAKRRTIAALVAPMDEKEAVLVAIHGNSTHGRRLTNADKRRAFDLYVENGLHLRDDGNVKSLRLISGELRRVVSHTSVRTYLTEMNIEPGDAEDDGLPVGGSWRASSPRGSEAEMVQDAATQVHQLRTLCDQLSDLSSLISVREELSSLLERLDEEITAQENARLEI